MFDYSLHDLLMFAPATYDRLFQRANDLWPAALMLGVLMLANRRRHALVFALLSSALLLVAYWFHFRHYAAIQLGGDAFAVAFVLQGLLLLVLARSRVTDGPAGMPAWPGLALVFYAILLHPLLMIVLGRAPQATELFAIAPDPTALATIGVVLSLGFRRYWPALLIPLLWLAVSGLTHVAMQRPSGLVAVLLASAAIVATLVPGRRSPGSG